MRATRLRWCLFPRFKAVRAAPRAGVSVDVIPYFRDLLEHDGLNLTDPSHLKEYYGPVLQEERQCTFEELKDQIVSLEFDGTHREG